MSDLKVSAPSEVAPKPKCGCSVVLNESYDNPEYEVDRRICLYPAAVTAYDEALRLKRKRNKQLITAIDIIKALVLEAGYMHTPAIKSAEEFLRGVK